MRTLDAAIMITILDDTGHELMSATKTSLAELTCDHHLASTLTENVENLIPGECKTLWVNSSDLLIDKPSGFPFGNLPPNASMVAAQLNIVQRLDHDPFFQLHSQVEQDQTLMVCLERLH